MATFIVTLPRTVIRFSGTDCIDFLQGLISNDVRKLSEGSALWAALLSAQGRWLADFFLYQQAKDILLDCEDHQAEKLIKTFSRFRLRAQVDISRTDLAVQAIWGDRPFDPPGLCVADPRLPQAGWRLVTPRPYKDTAGLATYDQHRLALALPDGSKDCHGEKTLLLEANFDLLNGIDWNKGCYIGQEITARMHYRGLTKQRLLPVVALDGASLPPAGTILSTPEMAHAATMASSAQGIGLAFVRSSLLYDRQSVLLRAPDEQKITSVLPSWMPASTFQRPGTSHP